MVDAPFMPCAGEALTDMIPQGREQWVSRVGGSTWNVTRALAVVGGPTAFAGAMSRDRFGDALWHASQAVGLDVPLLQRVDRAPLLAVVEQGEPPRYFFIGDDSADLHFDPATLPAGWADGPRRAHFGRISLAREPLDSRLVALARQLKARGVAISYGPNYRNMMDARYTATLEAMASLADMIKVSDDDLCGLFPGLGLDDALARLRACAPSTLAPCARSRVAVRARACSMATSTATRWRRGWPCWKGWAGDASAAGLLHSLGCHPDRPLQAHLHAALAAGSAACLQAGATRRHASIVRTA